MMHGARLPGPKFAYWVNWDMKGYIHVCMYSAEAEVMTGYCPVSACNLCHGQDRCFVIFSGGTPQCECLSMGIA